jgi:hypothetical protein
VKYAKPKSNAVVAVRKPKFFGAVHGRLSVWPSFRQARQPVPFEKPPSDETFVESELRKLAELPIPSYILSQPIPSGWELQRYEYEFSNQYGFYFLHSETKAPTAILWHDPDNVMGDDYKPIGDELSCLKPIVYDFPGAFNIGEDGDNAVEILESNAQKRIVLE